MEDLVPVGIFILCIAGALALVALAYFLYVLIKVLRNTVTEKVDPLLDDTKEILVQVKPIVGGVEPIMERVTLTIDAANLQIMRIDQIMEDVSNITNNVSTASNTVDKVTQAPLNLIAKATSAIREHINPAKNAEGTAGVVINNVDAGLECLGEKVATIQEENAAHVAEEISEAEARKATQKQTNDAAAHLRSAVLIKANADSNH